MMIGSHRVVSMSRVRLVRTGVTGGGHLYLLHRGFECTALPKGSSAEAQRVVGMAVKRAWTLGSVWMDTQGTLQVTLRMIMLMRLLT